MRDVRSSFHLCFHCKRNENSDFYCILYPLYGGIKSVVDRFYAKFSAFSICPLLVSIA